MHKLKTLGIVLLVALVLIAGGIWGYLWYSTKQQIEQIAALAKPLDVYKRQRWNCRKANCAGILFTTPSWKRRCNRWRTAAASAMANPVKPSIGWTG